MNFIYNIVIYITPMFLRLATPFSKKLKLFIQGRKGLIKRIEEDFNNFYRDTSSLNKKVIWFHCSSVGEFEQARPVIEWFKQHKEDVKIVLTFFSPSGYELRKNYDKADWVYYLPMDSVSNARRFIKAINPQQVIFTKYDLWNNFICRADKNGSELYLISAIFRKKQSFFRWWGGFFRNMLKRFDIIFVQDSESVVNLSRIGIKKNVFIAGDTRFDRVARIAKESKNFEEIEKFAKKSFTVVAGSSWGPDEILLQDVMHRIAELRLIIAPHEIHKERIEKVEQTFKSLGVIKYSHLTEQLKAGKDIEELVKGCRVLIIDCIGILSALYKYGDFAYIGGGFGAGIHNTLEAAVYGCPIAFGPKYHKFKEAIDLISKRGAESVNNAEELYSVIDKCLKDEEYCHAKGNVCLNYTKGHIGATEIIVNKIA